MACGDYFATPSPSGYQTTLVTGETSTVTAVFDGDTIEVEMNGRTYRVRYIGIDTPERDEPFYEEATQANRQLVGRQEVILVKDVSETDQYGRLLRYIYLQDGTFVNAELLRQGFAQIVTYPPDVAMQEEFQALQAEARTAGRGLWSVTELSDPAAPTGCATCDRNAYNCADFLNQSSAQACYDFCFTLTGEDIHHLDGGGDGVVCESLP
jgi:endonuclease YncB( thermonuclease family)